jgi:hypothetical protein
LLFLKLRVHVPPTSDKLQQNNAIAKHISFWSELALQHIFRSNITPAHQKTGWNLTTKVAIYLTLSIYKEAGNALSNVEQSDITA